MTWQTSTPRACAAYGFQSADFPSVVVLRASGTPCQLFEANTARGGVRSASP